MLITSMLKSSLTQKSVGAIISTLLVPKGFPQLDLYLLFLLPYLIQLIFQRLNIAVCLIILLAQVSCRPATAGAQPTYESGGAKDFASLQDQSPSTLYKPEGPVGIRYKKQIFTRRDFNYLGFQSHMQESAARKRHFLRMFLLDKDSDYEEDYLLLGHACPNPLYYKVSISKQGVKQSGVQDVISDGDLETMCSEIEEQEEGSDERHQQQLKVAAYMSSQHYKPRNSHIQNTFRNETLPLGGIQIQTMGDMQDFPRDNSYLNLALGIKPAYELPMVQLEELDQQQVIEGFLFKKAKSHNLENYKELQLVMDSDKLQSLEIFQKYAVTAEDPEVIATLTGGMRPISLRNLKPQSSLYRFFTQEIDISPHKLSFSECPLLQPRLQTLRIENKHRRQSVQLKAIIASTSELSVYPPQGVEFPYRLKPMEAIEIKIIFTSETLGLMESLLYLVLDDWVFLVTLNAYVVPNPYEIEPLYLTDVRANQIRVEVPLYIVNPLEKEALMIEEMYSTEEYVSLKWPNGEPITQKVVEGQLTEHILQYLTISPGQRHHLATLVFNSGDRPLDYFAGIHLRTSLHDILRVPIYYHVHTDNLLRLVPNTGSLDFGLLPMKMDLLKLPLKVKSRSRETLLVQDILVPVGDPRLDFLIIEPKAKGLSDKGIKRNQEVFLGYVLLNPNRPGPVEGKVIIQMVTLGSNKSVSVEIPIVGMVDNRNTIFGPPTLDNKEPSPPLIAFDISDYLLNQPLQRTLFIIPQYRPVILQAPLILRNPFSVPIAIRGVINENVEIRVTLLNDGDDSLLYQDLIIAPNETLKFAQLELLTTALKLTQGTKYLAIQTNHTLIPVQVQIYDRQLLCIWEEELMQVRYTHCSQGYDLNFGQVALSDPKTKRVNITNPNPIPMTIESVSKSQIDDLTLSIEKIVDRDGQIITTQWTEQPIIGPKRTKKVINLVLQPGHTMQLLFQVYAKEQRSKFSRVDFIIKSNNGQMQQDFSFNYNYQVQLGNLTLVPSVIRFSPGFAGMLQHRPLIARSTFDVPIQVKSIVSGDLRFLPTLHPTSSLIRPNNKTEFGTLTFDPNKSPNNGQPGQNQGNGQMDLKQFFSTTLGQIDPMIQHNLMQVLNSFPGLAQDGVQTVVGNPQIQIGGGPNGNKPILGSGLLPAQDLELYRDKQRAWESIKAKGKTEVTASVTIETSIIQNLTLQIKAQLAKPSIIDQEELDFELVQVGTSQLGSIKLKNPSEEPLLVQLFLVPTDLFQEYFANSSALPLDSTLEGDQRTPGDKDYYFHLYCQNKIQDLPSQNYNPKLDEVLINAKQNQKDVCLKVSAIYDKIEELYEEGDQVLQQLENYFKEMYLQEINPVKDNSKMNIVKLNSNQAAQHHPQLEQLFQGSNVFAINQTPQQMKVSPQAENLTQIINQLSQQRPFDEQTFELHKQKEKKIRQALQQQQSSLHSLNLLADSLLNMMKGLFITKPQAPQQSSQATPTPQVQNIHQVKHKERMANQAKKEQLKNIFRLKNNLLNELIILNDTQKFASYFSVDQDSVYPHQQSFFLNPKHHLSTFKIDPKSELTIQEALIFQPHTLHASQGYPGMTLLLKNNLCVLQAVNLKGSGGTGLIEVVKVLKKSYTSETYTNVHTPVPSMVSTPTPIDNSTGNPGGPFDVHSPAIKDRIINYIFGTQSKAEYNTVNLDQPREHVVRNSYYRQFGSQSAAALQAEQDRALQFSINAEDILILDDESATHHQDLNHLDVQDLTQLFSDQSLIFRFNTYHKRVFVTQNTGNLPLTVESISIEKQGCQAYGFKIENCHAFTLRPGEQHQLHLSYTTDYTIARVRKNLVLETKHFVQEFPVQVQLPINFLAIASRIIPLSAFEETLMIVQKLAIFFVGFTSLILVSRDIFSHQKFKQDQKEHIKAITIKQQQQDSSLKNLQRRELPIVKEMLGHEQIWGMYQQAQEKFENQNQLLLKEISNICSKKNLVCIEAQKQAIDAENKRRMNSRMNMQSQNQHLAKLWEHANSGHTKKDRESNQNKLSQEQSHQSQMPLSKDLQSLKYNSSSDQHLHTPLSKQESVGQDDIHPVVIQLQQPSDEKQRPHSSKDTQEKKLHSESKDSIFTDLSLNDSVASKDQVSQKDQQPSESQTPLSEEKKEESQISKKAAKVQTGPRIPKKLKREMDKRVKEQQEAEERFRQQEIEKQKQAEFEEKARQQRILKEQEQEKLRQAAIAAATLARERELEAFRKLQERLQQERIEREERERIQKIEQELKQKEVKIEEAPPSANQSLTIEQEDIQHLNYSEQSLTNIPVNISQQREFEEYTIEKDNIQAKQGGSQQKQCENDSSDRHHSDSENQDQINNDQNTEDDHHDTSQEQYPNKDLKSQYEEKLQSYQNYRDNSQRSINQEYLQRKSYKDQQLSQQKTSYQYVQQSYQHQQNYRGRGSSQYGQSSNNPYYQIQNQPQRKVQGQGYYEKPQGRGQSLQQQTTYVRGRYYNQQQYEEDDEHQYYEKKQPDNSVKEAPSQSQGRRVVINTLKNQPTSYQASTASLQRDQIRNRTSRQYRANFEDDDEYHEPTSYNRDTGSNYNQSYYKKPYGTKDYYDQDYDNEEQDTYYFQNSKRNMNQRKPYGPTAASDNYYDYKDYSSERDASQKPWRQENKYYPRESYQQPSTKTYEQEEQSQKYFGYEEKRKRRQGDQSLESEETYQPQVDTRNKEDERNKVVSYEQAKDKLSRDDLQPFFQSQKANEEQQPQQQEPKTTKNSMASPKLNSNHFGGSIFTFNPLSIFSQSSSNNQTAVKGGAQRDDSPEQSQTSAQSNSIDYHEEDKQTIHSGKGGNQTSGGDEDEPKDLYNVFKSASSLFSKPLFGATQSKTTAYRPYEAQKTQQPATASQNYSIFQRSNQPEEEEEQEQNSREENDQGLFSGSLFGDNSIFGGPNMNQSNMRNNQGYGAGGGNYNQYQSSYYRDPTQNYRGYPSMEGNDEEEEEENTGSLFGSGFGMNFQQDQQHNPRQQQQFQNWNPNQFFDDEDEDQK